MKTTFLSISMLLLFSCNSKSVEKIRKVEKVQEEEVSIVETEVMENDTSIVAIDSNTKVEEIVTEEPDDEETFDIILEFEKTSCFGKCPSFSVQLSSNGRMIYNGKLNVEKIGIYETTVNDSFIYTVFQEAEKINFFNFSDKYPTDGSEIPDLPKTITFLKNGKKEHRIIDSFYSPISLQVFEKYLLDKIDGLYWTKVGPQD